MKKINLLIFSLLIFNLSLNSQSLFEKGESQIYDFAVSFSSDELIYANDYLFNFIDLSKDTISHSFSTEVDQFVTRLALTSDDSLLIAGFYNGMINVYDVKNEMLVESFKDLSSTVSAIAISPDNVFLAAATTDGELIIYNLQTSLIISHSINNKYVSDLEFTADSYSLVCGGQAGLQIINPINGEIIDELTIGINKWIRGISINKGNNNIYYSGDNRRVMGVSLKGNHKLSTPFEKAKELSSISDVDNDSTDMLFYSTVSGKVKFIMPFGTYTKKTKELIYRAKIIQTSPQIKIAFVEKNKGLYLLKGKDMTFK